jgi:dGTPase
MDDIIKISVNNIYQSREVEKEIVGYKIIQTLLDKFITAYDKYNGTASNYDALILNYYRKAPFEKENLYDRLLHICHISLLTDGNLELYETINGRKKD